MSGVDFDPWAGQHLGAVQKPPGFDEFWEEQEAIHRGEKQPADFQSETGHQGQRGKGNRPKGKGRGKRRYNVPEQRAPRARPTHFVAIRLFSRMIRRNVQQMQQWFIAKNPLFEQCVVPVRRLHSSLLLTSIPADKKGEAQEACQEAGEEIRDFLGDQPVKIIASGISCFNGQILFTRLRTEPHDMLQAIHNALALSFMRHGFPVLDESAKSWLSADEEPHDFKAHASFIKVSKALAHAKSDAEKRQLRALRVTCDDLEAWRDVFFGTQICTEFELLDMLGSSRDGYYPCLKLEHFHDRMIVAEEPSLDVSLAAGPVRTAKLRVDPQSGAGMELSHCSAGYLIETLESWPGQPSLRQRDVIVAAGEAILLGLAEAEMEAEFRTAFSNGALLIVGPLDILLAEPLEHVRRAAKRLLFPWCREAEGRSVVSVSTVRTAAGMPRGQRYQLRASAQEFEPDPLSAPGGDPWANAAAGGHVYPKFSGWGTEFKKRKATVVDSFNFLPKTTSEQVKEAEPEQTQVHQRISQSLRRASSEEQVMMIVQRDRATLHVRNRILALVRLSSLSRERRSEGQAQKLRQLLDDLEEDLETMEEAKASVAPTQLADLALALSRLGLTRPELFHLMGHAVRRMGIWSFSDREAASLLEGFSRAKRCDEVIFQEASRLIMARAAAMEPKTLVAMMTAFACANIATETLFFLVGDLVSKEQGLQRWSLRLLAELADSFARVRARHALVLDIIPSHVSKLKCLSRSSASIEALVLLFSAYVDARQGFGPEGLRERLVEALIQRKAELSATLLRRLLQACARARWPSTVLLEAAQEIVAKDATSWEADAIYDCFLQLRVTPPADFPISPEKRQQRELRLAAKKERDTRWKKRDREDWDQNNQSEASVVTLRRCNLFVEEHGAGLVLECCGAGYLVDDCQNDPVQDVKPGEVIVAISSCVLIDLSEDEIEARFGAEFEDKAPLLVGVLEDLQKCPLEQIRAKVIQMLGEVSSEQKCPSPHREPPGPATEVPCHDGDGEKATSSELSPAALCKAASPLEPSVASQEEGQNVSSKISYYQHRPPRRGAGRHEKVNPDSGAGGSTQHLPNQGNVMGSGASGGSRSRHAARRTAEPGSGTRVWRPKWPQA